MLGTTYSGQSQHHRQPQRREWARAPTDEEEEEGPFDMELEDEEEPVEVSKNPVVVFRQIGEQLGEVSQWSKYNSNATHFLVPYASMPSVVQKKFEDRIDVRFIRATTKGLDQNVTNLVIGYHFMATPVHASPLMNLIKGARPPKKGQPQPKAISTELVFTDSISSIRQLLFLRLYYFKVIQGDAEYNKRCESAYQRIIKDIDETFFVNVDQILAQKETLDAGQAANLFGITMEQYMVRRIRAVEWNIMDLLKVPVANRMHLFTPNCFPEAGRLTADQGVVLRNNLCFYLRKRKEVYLGSMKELMRHKLLDNNANKNKMDTTEDEERPCQADKLQVLTLEADFQQPSNTKFKGYICCKTLLNYLEFLDTPKEEKKN